jgi:hypothetical protein
MGSGHPQRRAIWGAWLGRWQPNRPGSGVGVFGRRNPPRDVALNTLSLMASHSLWLWDELEAVSIPPLIVGVALSAAWASVLGIGLLRHRTWARRWVLLTFAMVSASSGMALFDTVGRVVGGGTAPVRHLLPASLFSVATSIVLLLAFAGQRDRS